MTARLECAWFLKLTRAVPVWQDRWARQLSVTTAVLLAAFALSLFTAAQAAASSTDRVSSLIVQYEPGRVPNDSLPLLGSSKVTGSVRQMLRLGPALGNDMWRVDFTKPVTRTVALRVAQQLADHRFIVFAEIDEPVGAFRPESLNAQPAPTASG